MEDKQSWYDTGVMPANSAPKCNDVFCEEIVTLCEDLSSVFYVLLSTGHESAVYNLTVQPLFVDDEHITSVPIGGQPTGCVVFSGELSNSRNFDIYKLAPTGSMQYTTVDVFTEPSNISVAIWFGKDKIPSRDCHDWQLLPLTASSTTSRTLGCLTDTSYFTVYGNSNFTSSSWPRRYVVQLCWTNYTDTAVKINSSIAQISIPRSGMYYYESISPHSLFVRETSVTLSVAFDSVPGLTCPNLCAFDLPQNSCPLLISTVNSTTGAFWIYATTSSVLAVLHRRDVQLPSGPGKLYAEQFDRSLRVTDANGSGPFELAKDQYLRHKWQKESSVPPNNAAYINYNAVFYDINNYPIWAVASADTCVYPVEGVSSNVWTSLVTEGDAAWTSRTLKPAFTCEDIETAALFCATATPARVDPTLVGLGACGYASYRFTHAYEAVSAVNVTASTGHAVTVSASHNARKYYAIHVPPAVSAAERQLLVSIGDMTHGRITVAVTHTLANPADHTCQANVIWSPGCFNNNDEIEISEGEGVRCSGLIEPHRSTLRAVYYVVVDVDNTTYSDNRYRNASYLLSVSLLPVYSMNATSLSWEEGEWVGMVSVPATRNSSFGFTISQKSGKTLTADVYASREAIGYSKSGQLHCQGTWCPFLWVHPSHMPAALDDSGKVYIVLRASLGTTATTSTADTGVNATCKYAAQMIEGDTYCYEPLGYNQTDRLLGMTSASVAIRHEEAACRVDRWVDTLQQPDSCCAVTPRCIAALKRFACLDAFRECDSNGFATPMCQSECKTVEQSCLCRHNVTEEPLSVWQLLDKRMVCNAERYGRAEPCTGRVPSPPSSTTGNESSTAGGSTSPNSISTDSTAKTTTNTDATSGEIAYYPSESSTSGSVEQTPDAGDTTTESTESSTTTTGEGLSSTTSKGKSSGSKSRISTPTNINTNNIPYALLGAFVGVAALIVAGIGIYMYLKRDPMPNHGVHNHHDDRRGHRQAWGDEDAMESALLGTSSLAGGAAAAAWYPTGDVAIVFVYSPTIATLKADVPGSLIRSAAQAMADTLRRRLVPFRNAVEVQSRGPSMMFAFHDAVGAVQWCLEVQKDLTYNTNWPSSLLEHPSCAAEFGDGGELLYRGPRVQMGVDVGRVGTLAGEKGALEYRGLPVDRAMRIAGAAAPGQIVVSEEVWNRVEDEGRLVPEVTHLDLGYYTLKGIEGKVGIHQVMPKELAGRKFAPLGS